MSWRTVLGCFEGPGKGVARYETENGEQLPNSAEFSGDKFPKAGNPAKVELKAWKRDNSAFMTDRKRENPQDLHGSALTGGNFRRYPMEKKPEPGAALSAAGKSPEPKTAAAPHHHHHHHHHYDPLLDKSGKPQEERHREHEVKVDMNETPAATIKFADQGSWRQVIGDVSFKQKPDGTVQIDIQGHPNEPLAQNPITQQPAPLSPDEAQKQNPQVEASRREAATGPQGTRGVAFLHAYTQQHQGADHDELMDAYQQAFGCSLGDAHLAVTEFEEQLGDKPVPAADPFASTRRKVQDFGKGAMENFDKQLGHKGPSDASVSLLAGASWRGFFRSLKGRLAGKEAVAVNQVTWRQVLTTEEGSGRDELEQQLQEARKDPVGFPKTLQHFIQEMLARGAAPDEVAQVLISQLGEDKQAMALAQDVFKLEMGRKGESEKAPRIPWIEQGDINQMLPMGQHEVRKTRDQEIDRLIDELQQAKAKHDQPQVDKLLGMLKRMAPLVESLGSRKVASVEDWVAQNATTPEIEQRYRIYQHHQVVKGQEPLPKDRWLRQQFHGMFEDEPDDAGSQGAAAAQFNHPMRDKGQKVASMAGVIVNEEEIQTLIGEIYSTALAIKNLQEHEGLAFTAEQLTAIEDVGARLDNLAQMADSLQSEGTYDSPGEPSGETAGSGRHPRKKHESKPFHVKVNRPVGEEEAGHGPVGGSGAAAGLAPTQPQGAASAIGSSQGPMTPSSRGASGVLAGVEYDDRGIAKWASSWKVQYTECPKCGSKTMGFRDHDGIWCTGCGGHLEDAEGNQMPDEQAGEATPAPDATQVSASQQDRVGEMAKQASGTAVRDAMGIAAQTGNRDPELRSWQIRRDGDFELVGAECTDACGIFIRKGGKPLQMAKTAREGHVWREVINQAEWEAKYEELLTPQ